MAVATLIALALGLICGSLINRAPSANLLKVVGLAQALGKLWSNALQMTILPLIVSSVIYQFAAHGNPRLAGRIGGFSLATFISLLGAAILFALLLAPPIISRLPLARVERPSPDQAAAALPDGGKPAPGLIDNILPANPVKAAVDGALLPLIAASILFAFALLRIEASLRRALLQFMQAISQTMQVLIGWIIRLMPFGVFALALSTSANFGLEAPGMIGYFFVLLFPLLILMTLLLYPISVFIGGARLSDFARAVWPAQAVALTTRSSLASLPALIHGAEGKLKESAAISSFVLPLSVSVFKVNRPVSGICTLLFLAHFYGIALTPATIAVFALTTLAVSFSVPGIPSGGKFTMMPAYIAAGIPVEGYILIRSVDAIPDFLKTALNVTGDMAALTIVARLMGRKRVEETLEMKEAASQG